MLLRRLCALLLAATALAGTVPAHAAGTSDLVVIV